MGCHDGGEDPGCLRKRTRQVKKKFNSIYANDYSETSGLSIFSSLKKMLFRWNKSVFKLIWAELLTFLVLYGFLVLFYQGLLCNLANKKWKQIFELLCIGSYNELKTVPIALMLGFYVRQVVGRWWDQFVSLPRPDRIALKLVNVIPPVVSLNFCCQKSTLEFEFLTLFILFGNYLKCRILLISALSTNFCSFKSDLSGNTV